MVVRVQSDTFDPGEELTAFSSRTSGSGAIVTFTGLVRDLDAKLLRLEIEHYPAMTQATLEDIQAKAIERWELDNCLIIHRFGQLKPDETIMMVATSSRHRAAAFEAAEFLMDYLKSRAPFWKKEIGVTGEEWVAAKENDEAALKRW